MQLNKGQHVGVMVVDSGRGAARESRFLQPDEIPSDSGGWAGSTSEYCDQMYFGN